MFPAENGLGLARSHGRRDHKALARLAGPGDMVGLSASLLKSIHLCQNPCRMSLGWLMSEFKAGVRVSLPASLSWVLWVSLGTLSGRGEPTLTNGQFVTRSWLKEDGLPQNTVTAVTQTRDGYLWVGTYNGLARFDGVKFTCFDSINTPEMGSSRVTSLFADREGTLWIGCEGGELTRHAGENFRAVQIKAQWGTRSIHAIACDQAGDMWIFNHTDCLLARLRDGLVLRAEAGHAVEWAQMASSSGGRYGSCATGEYRNSRMANSDGWNSRRRIVKRWR